MEPKLKQTAIEFAKASLLQLEAKGLKVTPEIFAEKTGNYGPQSGPLFPQKQADLLNFDRREKARKLAFSDLRRRLRDRKLWKRCQQQICEEWMHRLFAGVARKRQSAGLNMASNQLLLPGFDHCPATIGRGKYRVRLGEAPLARFLAFEARYQAKEQRNQQRAEELHRLAEIVRPFQETYPEMALGEAMRKAQTVPTKRAK